MGDLKNIGDCLATVLQERSLTLRTMARSCDTCGNEYPAKVYSRDDREQVVNPECPGCSAKTKQRMIQQEMSNYRRQCIDDRRKYWKENCGPQGIFAGKTFENFEVKRQPKAYHLLSNWKNQCLVLYSPGVNGSPDYGVGKTHLVSALANRLIAAWEYSNCPVLMTTEEAMLARIRNTYNRREDEISPTEQMVYDSLNKPELLIVDDVGKEKPKDLSFIQRVYYKIINARYVSGKPIILTANLSLEELEDHIGGSSSDRLREMAGSQGFICMKGQSYRRAK